MPVRVADYDVTAYEEEIKNYIAELDRNGIKHNPVSDGIYGMQIPQTVTIVFYFGTEVWNAPLCLSEMYTKENRQKHFNDYKVYLIDAKHLTDEDINHYHGDIKILFTILNLHEKMAHQPEKITETLKTSVIKYKMTYEVLTLLTNDDRYRKYAEQLFADEKEETNMCELLDYLEEKGRRRGISQGIQAMIMDNMEEGTAQERIAEKLQRLFELDEKSAWEYIKEYAGIKA